MKIVLSSVNEGSTKELEVAVSPDGDVDITLGKDYGSPNVITISRAELNAALAVLFTAEPS